METYFLDGDELMLSTDGNTAEVDFWSEAKECYEALDVTPWFLQELMDRAGLKLKVGERLGWREMGSQYSSAGYFAVMEVSASALSSALSGF